MDDDVSDRLTRSASSTTFFDGITSKVTYSFPSYIFWMSLLASSTMSEFGKNFSGHALMSQYQLPCTFLNDTLILLKKILQNWALKKIHNNLR